MREGYGCASLRLVRAEWRGESHGYGRAPVPGVKEGGPVRRKADRRLFSKEESGKSRMVGRKELCFQILRQP